MASYKESFTVETEEPDLKFKKLNASVSGADEPAGIELEDHRLKISMYFKPTSRVQRKNA